MLLVFIDFMNFLRDNFVKPDNAVSSRSRIKFIDFAKGICIILVVVFHSSIEVDIPNFDALRMPLYFVLSGLFFKDYGGLKIFTEKKINKLIIPFVTFYFVAFFIKYYANLILPGRDAVELNQILTPLYSGEIVNLPLWFLLSLFWCNIMYYLIHSASKSVVVKCCMVLSATLLGVILCKYQIILPLYVRSSLIALPFFYMGILLGNTSFLYPNKYDRYSLLIAVLFLGCAYAIYFCYDSDHAPFMSIFYGTWENNLILVYLNSLLMVLGVLMLCKTITWLPVISYMGRYSIMILVIHILILGNLAEVINLILGYAMGPEECLVYTLLLCWLLIPMMKKYLPYVTAQKDWFRLWGS